MNNDSKRTVLDNVADLVSGRINNTLLRHINQLEALETSIQTIIKEKELMNTAQEQAILNGATRIGEFEQVFRSGIQSLSAKIDELRAQAQSSEPTPEPVNLDDEMVIFNQALDKLGEVAQTLSGVTATGQSSAGGTTTGVVTGGPTESATPTPLAGESGTTNTPVDAEGNPIDSGLPIADQQQPGTDPATGQPAELPLPATTDQSASEIDGNKEQGTTEGVGGVTPNEDSSGGDEGFRGGSARLGSSGIIDETIR